MAPESLSLHRFVLAQSDADVTLKHLEALSPPPITSPFSPSLLDQHMALASGLFNQRISGYSVCKEPVDS